MISPVGLAATACREKLSNSIKKFQTPEPFKHSTHLNQWNITDYNRVSIQRALGLAEPASNICFAINVEKFDLAFPVPQTNALETKFLSAVNITLSRPLLTTEQQKC